MQEPQETWLRFLGPEDPLEKEMATHSSILAAIAIIPWTEEPGRLQSMGLQGVKTQLKSLRHNRAWMHTHTSHKLVKMLSCKIKSKSNCLVGALRPQFSRREWCPALSALWNGTAPFRMYHFFNQCWGSEGSQVVQWLRVHLPTQEM